MGKAPAEAVLEAAVCEWNQHQEAVVGLARLLAVVAECAAVDSRHQVRHDDVERRLGEVVRSVRKVATWQEIADAFGVTRQAAHIRFGGYLRGSGTQKHLEVSDGEGAKVAAAFESGASLAGIAQEFSRSVDWVAEVLASRGVRSRTRWDELEPVDPRSVADDYLAGASLQAVAARHGRSVTWVQKTLVSLGIPRRPRGRIARNSAEGACDG